MSKSVFHFYSPVLAYAKECGCEVPDDINEIDETPSPVADEAPAKKKPAKKAKKPAEIPAVDETPETPASPAEPLELIEKHGLQGYKPDDYDSVGFRVRMTEETASLVESGLFDDLKASLTMFRDETKKKQAKRAARSQVFKYVCPCCGNSVRATKMLNIGCFDCNELMTIE